MKRIVWLPALCIVAAPAAVWISNCGSVSDGSFPRQVAEPAQVARSDMAPRTVTLGPGTALRMGLGLTDLKPARYVAYLHATARVLSPQGLTRLSAAYAADTERLEVARAALAVARNEYNRQNTLYRENQTTSLKALQAARGALASRRAQAIAARRELNLDEVSIGEQWGPVLRHWFVAGSPRLEKILEQQEWLVQVTVSEGAIPKMPKTAQFVLPSGEKLMGRFLSSFPQANPLVQGLNFLYLIPARPGLAPGLNLDAQLATGVERAGVVIPDAAVVWADGRAWAYKESAPNRFERLAVATDAPVAGGWFVSAAFTAGDRVVTQAAAELLSAESSPRSKTGSEAETEDDD